MAPKKQLARGTRITHVRTPAPLPPSLAIESIQTSFIAPHRVSIWLKSASEARYDTRLCTMRDLMDDSLTGVGILPGDFLIFDSERTTPTDGAIMWVKDGDEYIPRIARVDGDFVEYHPAAEGYPVLSGERRNYGTIAALVRVYGALDVAPEAEEGGKS